MNLKAFEGSRHAGTVLKSYVGQRDQTWRGLPTLPRSSSP